MHRWLGVGIVALASALLANPTSAQPYNTRLAQAERQLRDAGTEGRFTLASERCRNAIATRTAQWMVVWCDLAATEALHSRNRANRRDYNEAERALLWEAAWLQALEGIQDGSFFATPLVERVSIADEVTERRLISYRLISALRSRDYRDIERYLRQLASLDGVTIGRTDTLLQGRRLLLEALLAQERTPERLWAIAATALTYELEYRGSDVTRDAVLADAREAATMLEGLEAETEVLMGQDAALLPLLLYAQAKVRWLAQDYSGGERLGQAGYEACLARLWSSASLCLDIGLEGALAGVLNGIVVANPGALDLPPEPPLSSRQRGEEYTEARCRVIIMGDAGDDGRFVNVRIVYENPERVCRAMALRYANDRIYRPIDQAMPGSRRQNLVIRFVLTSP